MGYTLSPQGQFTYQIEGHLYAYAKNSVFISGVLLMAFSAGAFSQPTLAVPPSAEVISAMPASEPATEAAASISSADLSDTVPIFPVTA